MDKVYTLVWSDGDGNEWPTQIVANGQQRETPSELRRRMGCAPVWLNEEILYWVVRDGSIAALYVAE